MSELIRRYAPSVADAHDRVLAVSTAIDVSIREPRIELFADQFGVDVTRIDDDLRRRFYEATGPTAFEVAQLIYVQDYWPRSIVIGEVLGGDESFAPPTPEPEPLWPVVEEFMRQVARLDALDPVTTELVRLRGARQHACLLCSSRRSVAAIEAGADDDTFAAVDDYAASDLPPATKAALALTDAVIWTPYLVPDQVIEAAATYLSPEQVVEVVLDVTRNATNKIAVALGADEAHVTEGVELFTTDADGNVSPNEGGPR